MEVGKQNTAIHNILTQPSIRFFIMLSAPIINFSVSISNHLSVPIHSSPLSVTIQSLSRLSAAMEALVPPICEGSE